MHLQEESKIGARRLAGMQGIPKVFVVFFSLVVFLPVRVAYFLLSAKEKKINHGKKK